MEHATDFNFRETVSAVWQAASAVTCHILFDAAIHGFVLASIIFTASIILRGKKHRFSRPLASVAKNIALLCAVFTIPGLLSLAITGKFPYTGVYNINSLGFLAFWSMVSAHLCFEEMNFQWFTKGPPPRELGPIEGYPNGRLEGADADSTPQDVANSTVEDGTLDFSPPASEPNDGADRPEEQLEVARRSK